MINRKCKCWPGTSKTWSNSRSISNLFSKESYLIWTWSVTPTTSWLHKRGRRTTPCIIEYLVGLPVLCCLPMKMFSANSNKTRSINTAWDSFSTEKMWNTRASNRWNRKSPPITKKSRFTQWIVATMTICLAKSWKQLRIKDLWSKERIARMTIN